MRPLIVALLILAGALTAAAPAAAPPRLSIPYDVELDATGRIFVADGGKHQIFRWDARRKKLVVVAGTGKRGASGDGGQAVRARLDEIAGLAVDHSGNLYVADVHYGVVRRIDRRGIISTVARVPGAAGVAVDPSGRYLAVASIPEGVFRVELATGTREPVLVVGEHGLTGAHGLAYDASGSLWIADPGSAILRVDPSGAVETISNASSAKVAPLPGGGALIATGSPSGGRIQRIEADGTVTTVAGNGKLGRHVDGVAATRVGILPTDAAPLTGGAFLVGETKPVPSIRRVDRAGKITTLVR